MGEYRLSPSAQRDLGGVFDYTVAQWGVDQAVRYIDLIEEACRHLASAPHQSSDCGTIRPGYRRRVIGSHTIYFQAVPYGIAVIRILHQRMDANRHL